MPIILALAAMAAMAIRLAPHSPLGRILSLWLVEAPARALSRITPGKTILFALILLAAWAAIAIAKTEGGFLVAQGAPEGMAWLLTLDVASYVDAIAVAWLLAASVRLKAVKAAAHLLLAKVKRPAVRRTARARRSRLQRPRSLTANDDDPAPLLLAA